jgi:hypothetical protein
MFDGAKMILDICSSYFHNTRIVCGFIGKTRDGGGRGSTVIGTSD